MKFQLSALVSLGAFLAVEAGVAGVSQSQSLSARDGVDLAVRSAAANMTWADLESGADAAAICGSLGVFELPEGSDPALVRLCSDHPSLARPGSNAGGVGTLACAKNQQGCDGGYCWKQCGENGAGWWCWTALGDGSGPWKTCVAGSDCGMGDPCGWSKNACPKCGCSC